MRKAVSRSFAESGSARHGCLVAKASQQTHGCKPSWSALQPALSQQRPRHTAPQTPGTAGQRLKLIMRRRGLCQRIVEVDECLICPLWRHTQQVQQVPNLDRMYLQRSRRQKHQPWVFPRSPSMRRSRAFGPRLFAKPGDFRRAWCASSRMTRSQGTACIQYLSRAFCTPHQLAGSQNNGFIVPLVVDRYFLHSCHEAPAIIPLKAMSVIDRPIQIELLAEF